MLDGRCAESDVSSIICRHSHHCTAPVRTLHHNLHEGRLVTADVVRETLASYTMAALNIQCVIHLLLNRCR